uniref:Uncharacterized protein n=1 Tax=Nonomuraea gerenzanensis TaxID=93944 RepID=A0A1M4EKB6_9ACTN|nr:hypothetical protein BN4615_P8826 [Nonomuraea gerenzanensis]
MRQIPPRPPPTLQPHDPSGRHPVRGLTSSGHPTGRHSLSASSPSRNNRTGRSLSRRNGRRHSTRDRRVHSRNGDDHHGLRGRGRPHARKRLLPPPQQLSTTPLKRAERVRDLPIVIGSGTAQQQPTPGTDLHRGGQDGTTTRTVRPIHT